MSLENIIVVLCQSENVAAAFLNGEVDAAVIWEPWLSQALKRTGAHVLISSKERPGIIVDTLNIKEDIVKNNPKLVKGLMRAWFRAVQYYKEHPLEASEIIAKYYGISANEYRKNISGLAWTDYTKQIQSEKYLEWTDVFNTIAEIKLNNARILQKPDAKSAINQTLLKGLYENSQ